MKMFFFPQVGYERKIEVAPGQTVIMKTAAIQPKAFG